MLPVALGLFCGATMSLRFDIFVLLPLTLMGWLLVAVGGLVVGAPILTILLAMVWATIALQVGYMIGIAGQWLVLSSGRLLPRVSSSKASIAPDGAGG